MPRTRMPLIAVVPSDLSLKLSIPILENFAPPIFNEAGRTGVSISLLDFGNPAASISVQSVFNSVSEEQLRAHIVPKQAVPFIFYRNFCSWQGYGIERWRIRQSVLRVFLFWLEIKRPLKLYSSARIEVLIWDV